MRRAIGLPSPDHSTNTTGDQSDGAKARLPSASNWNQSSNEFWAYSREAPQSRRDVSTVNAQVPNAAGGGSRPFTRITLVPTRSERLITGPHLML